LSREAIMKVRIVGFIAGTAVALSLIVVPAFGTGGTADAGCKEFGQATSGPVKGVKGGWGPDTKANNAAGDPGVIADNVAGAKAALCD
jgi:hypothetical protein